MSLIGPVNIGNPVEYRMIDLAEQIRLLAGSRSPIVFKPHPSDDPKQRRPGISNARELLGSEPKVPLEAGLKETVTIHACSATW
jgi:nucleoside-diphosphate-sugar epimerase